MAMTNEQYQELIAIENSIITEELSEEASSSALNMQRRQMFDEIYNLAKTVITKEDLIGLITKNANTQTSERKSIPLVKNVLDQLGLSYTKAGSQQSKDFRNVGGIGLNIEVKKTDGTTVIFNDTCPNENIWYLILFTGKENSQTSIPPGVLGMNGAVFIDDSEWISDYQREIDAIKDKYCRGEGKKALSGKMSVYARPTYTGDITEFLDELKE